MENQYYLSVTGNNIKEEGFFFKATPFEIKYKGTHFNCIFEHNKTHEAVLNIYHEKNIILEVEHPFYLPDSEADHFFDSSNHKEYLEVIIHALIHLKIGKSKSFDKYMKDLSFNYEVFQKSFYEVEIQ